MVERLNGIQKVTSSNLVSSISFWHGRGLDGIMDTTSKKNQLQASKRVIAQLTRTCRQVIIYLDGKSCLSETTLKQNLQKSIRVGEDYENTDW